MSDQRLKIANITAGSLMVLGSFPVLFQFSLQGLANTIFLWAAAAAVLLLEFRSVPLASHHAPFLGSFIGRGILYIYASLLIIGASLIPFLSGFLLLSLGGLFVWLQFSGILPPSESMRLSENDDTV